MVASLQSLWVKSTDLALRLRCRHYPRWPTSEQLLGMVEKGQFRTHAPQQTHLFDHLIGTCEQRQWNPASKCFGGLEVDREQPVIGLRGSQANPIGEPGYQCGLRPIGGPRCRRTAEWADVLASMWLISAIRPSTQPIIGPHRDQC